MSEPVSCELRDGGIAVIRLDQPETLNALRQSDIHRLGEILDWTADDAEVRVIVITSVGRAFCSGINLKELAAQIDDAPHEHRKRVEAIQDLTRKMSEHPAIVIAAVNGLAVGMGAEIAVAADMRLAAETATFAFPEVTRAVSATNGSTFLLPRIVGSGRALHWLVTGETVSAAEALASGLVTGVYPNAALLETALGYAERLAASSPVAVRLVKQLLREGQAQGADLETMLAREVEGTLECFASDDVNEGMESFLKRRDPGPPG